MFVLYRVKVGLLINGSLVRARVGEPNKTKAASETTRSGFFFASKLVLNQWIMSSAEEQLLFFGSIGPVGLLQESLTLWLRVFWQLVTESRWDHNHGIQHSVPSSTLLWSNPQSARWRPHLCYTPKKLNVIRAGEFYEGISLDYENFLSLRN